MTLSHNKHRVEIFDGALDALPVARFQLYNLNLLRDAGIGSDLNDFHQRIASTLRLIDKDPQKAKIELSNLQQNVVFLMSNVNPKMRAFVCLIKSINGKEVRTEDLTDEGIDAILARLEKAGTTWQQVCAWLDDFKKKVRLSLKSSSLRWLIVQQAKSITQN